MVTRSHLLCALALVVGVACADDPCPRGSMVDSDQGLIVSEQEHPTGWGAEDCSECHAFATLHQLDCTPNVDWPDVDAMVADHGVASCSACHGDNGVSP